MSGQTAACEYLDAGVVLKHLIQVDGIILTPREKVEVAIT